MPEFLGQVGVDDVIQAVLCQSLLLRANTHLEQQFDGTDPILVVPDEGIVFDCILGAFYVHIF